MRRPGPRAVAREKSCRMRRNPLGADVPMSKSNYTRAAFTLTTFMRSMLYVDCLARRNSVATKSWRQPLARDCDDLCNLRAPNKQNSKQSQGLRPLFHRRNASCPSTGSRRPRQTLGAMSRSSKEPPSPSWDLRWGASRPDADGASSQRCECSGKALNWVLRPRFLWHQVFAALGFCDTGRPSHPITLA
jgi:hypothetical protein